MRLANLFPELFHCSGFAIFGKATVDGHLYHGRILDYLRGMGLEQNAVVMVFRPDRGNAWVNVGYAGFIGSVTAMNEKGIAIGEVVSVEATAEDLYHTIVVMAISSSENFEEVLVLTGNETELTYTAPTADAAASSATTDTAVESGTGTGGGNNE
ncbi:MAG: hypothetical protein HGA54_03905 [Actinobacteria bacterium]|nr:hypothetical protein [Actinomycetota bacterium]